MVVIRGEIFWYVTKAGLYATRRKLDRTCEVGDGCRSVRSLEHPPDVQIQDKENIQSYRTSPVGSDLGV